MDIESFASLHARLAHWLNEIEIVQAMQPTLFSGWKQLAIRVSGVYVIFGVRHRLTAWGWDENDVEIEANYLRLAIVTQSRQAPVTTVDLDAPATIDGLIL